MVNQITPATTSANRPTTAAVGRRVGKSATRHDRSSMAKNHASTTKKPITPHTMIMFSTDHGSGSMRDAMSTNAITGKSRAHASVTPMRLDRTVERPRAIPNCATNATMKQVSVNARPSPPDQSMSDRGSPNPRPSIAMNNPMNPTIHSAVTAMLHQRAGPKRRRTAACFHRPVNITRRITRPHSGHVSPSPRPTSA